MFYQSDQVDNSLKCSFCQERFVNVVKVIPACGNFICGECSDALELDDSNRFKCKACSDEELHTMPKNGFANQKALMDLIKLRPIANPLSKYAEQLKSSIETVQNKIKYLKSFSITEEVNSYCANLEMEVSEATESEINHIKRLQDELLNDVSEYRQELLQSAAVDTDRQTDTLIQTVTANESVVTKLSTWINGFSEKWLTPLTLMDSSIDYDDIKNAQRDVDLCLRQLDDFEDELRAMAFKNRLKTFKPSRPSCGSKNSIGKLEVIEKDDKCVKMIVEQNKIITTQGVTQILFLPNHKLAACSSHVICIWQHFRNELVFQLSDGFNNIYSLALLPNSFLASGGTDTHVKIWCLVERKVVMSLTGHSGCVFSLLVLRNGNLASCSTDNTIMIWNSDPKNASLLFTLNGNYIEIERDKHGRLNSSEYQYLPKLDLANGVFFSCSNLKQENSVLNLWNPDKGVKIASITTSYKNGMSFKVLTGDRIAVGFEDGTIEIISYRNKISIMSIDNGHSCGVNYIELLPNGLLLSSSRYDREIKVWNLKNGKFESTVDNQDAGYVRSIRVSPDGALLAAPSSNGIKLYSLIKAE